MLEGLGWGAQIDPHVKQAVVLQADVQGVVVSRVAAGDGGQGDSDVGGQTGRAEEGRAVVISLHALLTLFDREVLWRGCGWVLKRLRGNVSCGGVLW